MSTARLSYRRVLAGPLLALALFAAGPIAPALAQQTGGARIALDG